MTVSSSITPDRGPSDWWLRGAILAAAAGLLLWSFVAFDLGHHLAPRQWGQTVQTAQAWVHSFGSWAPVIYILAGGVALASNIPGILLVHISAVLFGMTLGAGVAVVMVALGTSIAYLVGHRLGRPVVLRLIGQRGRSVQQNWAHRSVLDVILLRLVLFLSPALMWWLSLSGLPWRTVVGGTFIGTLPGILLIAWLTETIAERLVAGHSINPVHMPELIIPLLLAAILFVYATWERRRRGLLKVPREPSE